MVTMTLYVRQQKRHMLHFLYFFLGNFSPKRKLMEFLALEIGGVSVSETCNDSRLIPPGV